ncbi:MAG: MFS transporter [Acidimicrobiia bacterium]
MGPFRRLRWSVAPPGASPDERRNFRYVQIDALGIGMANVATIFLPVFLTRLGATNFQIGLLTAMPAATGLVLAIIVGNFLQRQRNVVPWFSASRALVVSCFAATGIAPWLVPEDLIVQTILIIWAAATLPQTAVAIAFSVVMNAVAGPAYRYDLMSRRWSILGLVTAVTVLLVGQALERIGFPLNYQVVFVALSIGGLISYLASSRVRIPDRPQDLDGAARSLAQRWRDYFAVVHAHPDFVRFLIKRFVFLSGTALAAPLFPLYFVREVGASDAAIGTISMAQTIVLVFGYAVWMRVKRRRGPQVVLVVTTLSMSLYPALVAATTHVPFIVLLAGLAGVVSAGIDLVFFDELMKRVPVEHSATFVSIAQSLQYASAVAFPLIGATLATVVGLSGALVAAAVIRLAGALLFAFWRSEPAVGP